jgi:hypothetical protein
MLMPDDRRVIKSRFRMLEEWSGWINEHAVPDTDPNPTILAGTGGRPASREELIAFAREHRARIAREHPDW